MTGYEDDEHLNEPEFTAVERYHLRILLHEDEGKRYFRKAMRERMKVWGIWIAAVTTMVGFLKGAVGDYWIGKH